MKTARNGQTFPRTTGSPFRPGGGAEDSTKRAEPRTTDEFRAPGESH
ncbi:hypothetical protein JIG36_36295 [Actinoplanes sp. LDG1-06]|uniref:Uncharacterized protein n=1 Tax=Paractinoplanes ovalisporus TaxID=2810368 RepID=A0ABS2AMF0_9ACTN|nr:hypothetical protein [Actinoplanes ovalisporus]MBM2620975.1 hypothetical protein [Actinoplanes ovalisporus]